LGHWSKVQPEVPAWSTPFVQWPTTFIAQRRQAEVPTHPGVMVGHALV
jgi:hypothetical protein